VYIVLVLLQTVVLPLISTVIMWGFTGAHPIVAIGLAWGFWGVGTRLLVAGISQLMNPSRTTKGILGIEDAGAEQVVHELGFANLAFGVGGLLVPFFLPFGVLLAVPGALYLGLAGVRHIAKRGKGAAETVAMWTDLLVFVMVFTSLVFMLLTR
jgi:hypothetical protein